MWKGLVKAADLDEQTDHTHTLSLMSPGCLRPGSELGAHAALKGLGLERLPWAVFRGMSVAWGRRKWPDTGTPRGGMCEGQSGGRSPDGNARETFGRSQEPQRWVLSREGSCIGWKELAGEESWSTQSSPDFIYGPSLVKSHWKH